MTIPRALAAALIAVAAGAPACGNGDPVRAVEVSMHYSKYAPGTLQVPVGKPVRFELHNDDPIDHEFIVGDAALHERHETGTEPRHDERPTEVSVDALTDRTTVITFTEPGTFTYACHLPGHRAYGMEGTLIVTP